jgi:hypothetical protein
MNWKKYSDLTQEEIEERRAYQRKWYLKNKEKFVVYEKNYVHRLRTRQPEVLRKRTKHKRLKHVYKISLADYEVILKNQNYLCPICNVKLDQEISQIDVDHCHASGKIRGILHNKCNRLLSCCKDDVKILKSAIAYLERKHD